MVGRKEEITTITNKQYFRDDGLYIYSPADGDLYMVSDSDIKIDSDTTLELESAAIELEGTITLDGDTTLDTGHYIGYASNDGVVASGLGTTNSFWSGGLAVSSAQGWIKVKIGSDTGYMPVFDSAVLA